VQLINKKANAAATIKVFFFIKIHFAFAKSKSFYLLNYEGNFVPNIVLHGIATCVTHLCVPFLWQQ